MGDCLVSGRWIVFYISANNKMDLLHNKKGIVVEQYIPKSVVLAEIKRRIKRFREKKDSVSIVKTNTYKGILSFIDTIEAREKDLDFQRFAKEMDAIFALPSSETKNTEEEPLNWEYAIAKHFFELGLKAQKGEKV